MIIFSNFHINFHDCLSQQSMKVNKYEWLVESTSSDVEVRKLFNSLFFWGPKSQDLGLQSKNFYATFI